MKTKPNLGIGILVMLVVALMMFYVMPYIAYYAGVWAVPLNQTLFLLCALIPVFVFKWDICEVFPVKMPSMRQLTAIIVLWLGSISAIYVIQLLMFMVSPTEYLDTLDRINDVIKDVPSSSTLLIFAATPAICEEFLHRGFIQYTFINVKNKWVTISIVGLIFGLFHTDVYRFLPTAVLGMVLSYIMMETKNILMPMLFHFLNNSISLTGLNTDTSSVENIITYTEQGINPFLLPLGAALIMFSASPFFFMWGSRMLSTQNNKISIKTAAIASIISLLTFSTGIIIIVHQIIQAMINEGITL